MSIRQYDFIVGPETSTPPTAGTPSDPSDLVNLTYGNEYYGMNVSGSRSSPNAITASGGITHNNKMFETIFIQGSGGAVDVSANPQIASGTKLCAQLYLVGRSDSNPVKLKDGAGLALNGNFSMKENCILGVTWDGTNWAELYRSER